MPLDTVSTSARTELPQLNREIELATVDRDEAQRAFDRLRLPVTELDKAIANLAAVRATYDARISAWYADGCPGARPPEPIELADLENAVRRLTEDSGASRPAFDTARNALNEANASLGSLATQKQSALFRNAVEAAREYLEHGKSSGHGTKGFRAWWHAQRGYWLMRRSKEAAEHFCLRAMCRIAPDELQNADR